MASRAATATIKGYYYQFDTSILKLLNLAKEEDSIIVEGIEDIDINTATETTTIQCKYLSKPKFINSAVREPIILMLDHFVSPTTPTGLIYTLYAHFENEEPGASTIIDLERLKDILTYTESGKHKCHHKENGISDAQLNSFLKNFNLVFGEEFEAQQKKVLNKLREIFSCTEFVADTHYYNNGLRIIIDKAIKKDSSERKIPKGEFLKAIDVRDHLFNEWYILLRSKEEYLKKIQQNLKTSRALEPSKYKYLIIGADLINCENHELPCISFIQNLVNKYYRMEVALRTAKPFTIIFDCDIATLLEIKKQLISNQIYFNDGFEHIEFNCALFNEDPVINRNSSGQKIVKSSYWIRILSIATLVKNIEDLNKPKVLFHFSRNACPYPHSNGYQWFDIKYCETLSDISKLIM